MSLAMRERSVLEAEGMTMTGKMRPILMSGAMVRGLKGLERGRVKTQTRRVFPQLKSFEMKREPKGRVMLSAGFEPAFRDTRAVNFYPLPEEETAHNFFARKYCRYGAAGDGLWIKETWAGIRHPEGEADEAWFTSLKRPYLKWPEEQGALITKAGGAWMADAIVWRADGGLAWADGDGFIATRRDGTEASFWRSPLFMPYLFRRQAIDQVITFVRCERLQAMTEADAKAEGIPFDGTYWRSAIHPVKGTLKCWPTALMAYEKLWDSLNAKPKPVRVGGKLDHYVSYPWEDVRETREHRGKPWHVRGNPWVWVIGMKRKQEEKRD